MGAAWCRNRIEQAQNSKSPVDRIITRCSNAISTKSTFPKQNQSKPANDIVFKQIRGTVSGPVPVHQPRSGKSHHQNIHSEWQDVPLQAMPDKEESGKTPVPPPRKRKRRKVNSLEVLNSQLDRIYESSYQQRKLKSMPMYGDPLPVDSGVKLDDSSPERSSPVKSAINDCKRKSRARKIMDTKTKLVKKDAFQPLSVLSNDVDRENYTTNGQWKTPGRKMVKNISSVSLPSYHDLNNHAVLEESPEKEPRRKSGPRRNISTVSLPGESVLTSLSGVTMQRLEAYLKRCRSFGSLKPQQLLEKLEEITNKQETESSDSWSGLDDWDLGIIEYHDTEKSEPPLVPKSRLASKHGPRMNEPIASSEALDEEYEESNPPSRQRESPLPDNTLSSSNPTHNWFSKPLHTTPDQLKTPPPTPDGTGDHRKEDIMEDDSHSTLLKILTIYKKDDDLNKEDGYDEDEEEETGSIPTPPRRKSRDCQNRRQSYQDARFAPKSSQLMLRSMSLGTTLDDILPNMSKKWQNLSMSSSRHSIQYALSDFLGFDTHREVEESQSEGNLNSSSFPVIGLGSEDKGVAEKEEEEDDHKTPPPLPTSPPPYTSNNTISSLPLVNTFQPPHLQST